MVLYYEVNFGVQVQPGWHVFPSLQPPFLYPPPLPPHPASPCSNWKPEQCITFCFLACAVIHAAPTACSSPPRALFSIFFPFSPSGNNLVFLRKCPWVTKFQSVSLSPYFCYTSTCIESYLSYLLEFWGKRSYFIYSCVFHLLRLNENSVNEIFETKLKNLLVIPWFHL